MQYHRIKNTDLSLSAIALGTWVFSGDVWGGAKERDCINAVSAAMDLGVNLIDTAPIYGYGLAEKIVGKAIKGKRDKVILATKCGLIGKGRNIVHNLKPDSIQKELEQSLKRLDVDCIDIYQCHWPDPKTPIAETMNGLCRLKEQGKIRYIGVSNFETDLLKQAMKITQIVTLQSQYSLLERSVEKELLPLCVEQGVGMITYGPLGGGILSGKYSSAPRFRGADARNFFYKFYSGEKFDQTQKLLAHLKNMTHPLNQIAINWVRQQPGVTSVIVGCRNKEQAEQNITAANWELIPDEVAAIRGLLG